VCFPIDFVVCRFHNCFMGQAVSQIRKGLAMSVREIVARERLDNANWEREFYVVTSGKSTGRRYDLLVSDCELAELRLRAVLGNIAQGG